MPPYKYNTDIDLRIYMYTAYAVVEPRNSFIAIQIVGANVLVPFTCY